MSDRHLLRVVVVCGVGAILCFAAMAFCGCAASRSGKVLNVGVGVASAADYVTTRQGISRGAIEANPILGDGALRQAVIKAAGVSAVIGLASLVEIKGRPVLAHVLRVIVIAGYSAAAIHNAGIHR